MAYDAYLADRIRRVLNDKQIYFSELKMMGGLCFKVDNKMLCAIFINKNYGDSLIMARIGESIYLDELKKPECLSMDFTGRAMKGYIYVTPEGFDTEDDLEYWIQLCLNYNPLAKASKPKKKKPL
jgi:hypothetical protein